ncbi:MAG TPA: glycosyltransferase family 9 protein [Alphaproteobacteria bacterium]|nr:glycosyltransferase family 9 protein [Alphaproteobacteria bacterium]
MKSEQILVIRLGALGDLILCFQAFHEIRKAHPDAEIALLTTPAFGGFAKLMPWFDRVIIGNRAPGWRLDHWGKLTAQVHSFRPTRVYDLQGKLRQDILYAMLGGPFGPEWSGAAPGCSHPRLWPPEPGMHYTDFVEAQLRRANVPPQSAPDLSWLDAPLDGFDLPERYAVLIPGCAPDREYKRWPAASYAALAAWLKDKGIASVAVGTAADAPMIAAIRAVAPDVIDFSSRTNLPQLAGIFRRAVAIVGNDTGPTHLAAAVGAPTLALMSDRVNPVWSAPKGTNAAMLQGTPLSSLSPDKVFLALTPLLDRRN